MCKNKNLNHWRDAIVQSVKKNEWKLEDFFFFYFRGMWIRTKAGRNKRKWRKTISRKRRAQRHVMTTASQSWLLDTMVTKFWRRPKHYVDDPYAPYHKRESFPFTRTKPLP